MIGGDREVSICCLVTLESDVSAPIMELVLVGKKCEEDEITC